MIYNYSQTNGFKKRNGVISRLNNKQISKTCEIFNNKSKHKYLCHQLGSMTDKIIVCSFNCLENENLKFPKMGLWIRFVCPHSYSRKYSRLPWDGYLLLECTWHVWYCKWFMYQGCSGAFTGMLKTIPLQYGLYGKIVCRVF